MSTCSYFSLLPEEMVVRAGRFLDLSSLASLQQVERRMRDLFRQEGVIKFFIKDARVPSILASQVETYEQLAFFIAAKQAGLMEENRIAFDYASTEIDDDNPDLRDSTKRVSNVRLIFEKFCHLHVTVEAHCGRPAPAALAPAFSRVRGLVVSGEILDEPDDEATLHNRITTNAWGRQITILIASNEWKDHPHNKLAREGRGWVELYLRLGSVELPERPEYWNNLEIEPHDTDETMIVRDYFP